jgi:hypothetical protein
VTALLEEYPGAAKQKVRLRPPRPRSPLSWVGPLACIRGPTRSLLPCTEWENAAAALCCRREGVEGGGWEAAGCSPWRCQGEGRGAPAAPAQVFALRCSACVHTCSHARLPR